MARNLLSKLGGEKVRWLDQAKNIELEFKKFPLDSLLSAAFVVYLADACENVREKTKNDWKQLIKNIKFDFLNFMTTESKILKWKSMGLPGDSLTLENSVIIFNSYKTPLLIDPNT